MSQNAIYERRIISKKFLKNSFLADFLEEDVFWLQQDGKGNFFIYQPKNGYAVNYCVFRNRDADTTLRYGSNCFTARPKMDGSQLITADNLGVQIATDADFIKAKSFSTFGLGVPFYLM